MTRLRKARQGADSLDSFRRRTVPLFLAQLRHQHLQHTTAEQHSEDLRGSRLQQALEAAALVASQPHEALAQATANLRKGLQPEESVH